MLERYIFSYLLIVLLSFSGQAQNQWSFKTNIDNVKLAYPLLNGQFMTAFLDGTGNAANIRLSKIDENLEEEWTILFGSAGQEDISQLFCDDANNCYLTGISRGWGNNSMSTYIVKVNSNGTIAWTKYLDEGGWNQPGGCSLRKSDMTLHCFTKTIQSGNGDLQYVKLDTAGNELLGKKIDVPTGEIHPGNKVFFADNGDIVFSAFGKNLPNSFGGNDLMVVKVDAQANVVWGKQFGSSGDEGGSTSCYASNTSDEFYVITASNSYSVSGENDLLLLKMNLNGTVLWSKNIGSEAIEYIRSGSVLFNNNIDELQIVMKHLPSNSITTYSSSFLGISSNGTITREKNYGVDTVMIDILSVPDGLILVGGNTTSSNYSKSYKVDNFGSNNCLNNGASILTVNDLTLDVELQQLDVNYSTNDFSKITDIVVTPQSSTISIEKESCNSINITSLSGQKLCPDDSVMLSVVGVDGIEWENVTDGILLGQFDTLKTVFTDTVTYKAVDVFGESSTISIGLKEDKECVELVVYTIFSPDNGDAVNNVFWMDGLEAHGPVEVTVTTRTGELLFETKDYKNNWSAEGVPEGVYYYTVKAGANHQAGALKIVR